MKKLKKLLVVLAGVVTVVCLAVGLAGCASDVDGNTYTFSSVSISLSGDDDNEEEWGGPITDELISYLEENYTASMEDTTISFANGVATLTQSDYSETYSYSQDGTTITLYYYDTQAEADVKFTVSGSSLVWEQSHAGLTIKYTFKN